MWFEGAWYAGASKTLRDRLSRIALGYPLAVRKRAAMTKTIGGYVYRGLRRSTNVRTRYAQWMRRYPAIACESCPLISNERHVR